VQDNHSLSKPGVLRGLHFQTQPSQGKLVGCSRGRIWDVAVDLRPHSQSYGKWYSAELSAENGRLLWIPSGFAHGFCVLGDEPADVQYKVDAFYNPKMEFGIRWDDPDLQIPWPIKNPIVSERDSALPSFADYRVKLPVWS
jgi:dTDP-4-dehydrorhamnose 3,5-epimerase